jgi:NADH-quinone oxidoreductase subunit L
MGGLRRTHRSLAWLLGLGLAALAGLPPLSGFWSKEAVLSAAEHGIEAVGWPAQLVLASGLLTTLVTGAYAGRALAIVAFGDPPPTRETVAEIGAHTVGSRQEFPAAMTWPLWALAVPTALLGFVLFLLPAALRPAYFDLRTAVAGTALAVIGVTWGLEAAATWEDRDAVLALPVRLRTFLRDGYRLDEVQHVLVVRPYEAGARLVRSVDHDVVDGYIRAVPVLSRWGSAALGRAQSGLATGYLAWVAAGAVVVGLIGLVLS